MHARGGLGITFPVRRSWPAVFILALPLAILIWALYAPPTDDVLLFRLFGLLILGGLAYPWLAMLVGRETIVIDQAMLTRRREVFRIGWSERFELDQIRDLRVAPEQLINVGRYISFRAWYERSPAERSPWSLYGQSIAFEYGAGTRRIGTGLDAAEAEYVVGLIRPYVGSADKP
jgi:hypothetical protein